MVKNDFFGHSEDPGNPWYTWEGHVAAQNGNIILSGNMNIDYKHAIHGWITGPFHQVAILDPQFQETGFGLYREPIGVWQFGATLDVLRGRRTPTGVTYPIMFPADGKVMPLTHYGGGEVPDPLAPCSGYTPPTGPSIVLQVDEVPAVTAFSFRRDSETLEACVYDETTYTHSDPTVQAPARGALAMRHAIILIPRDPLTPGTYQVSITTNGTTYAWSFAVAGAASEPGPPIAIGPVLQ